MCLEKRVTDGVTGWRGILGWICPAIASSSVVMDFHSVVPQGIELKIITLGITATTQDQVDAALAKLDDAASRLAFNGAQFIAVEGTPLVSLRGFGFDREIIRRVEKAAGVPATTSLSSVIEACRLMNLKKLILASPLGNEVNTRTREFLEQSGINVIHLKSLNNVQSRDTEKLPRSAAYTFGRQAYDEAPGADSIYMPSGSWCPPWVVDRLEQDLGVTVLHSRQVTTWAGLRSLRIKEPVKGWGRLFDVS